MVYFSSPCRSSSRRDLSCTGYMAPPPFFLGILLTLRRALTKYSGLGRVRRVRLQRRDGGGSKSTSACRLPESLGSCQRSPRRSSGGAEERSSARKHLRRWGNMMAGDETRAASQEIAAIIGRLILSDLAWSSLRPGQSKLLTVEYSLWDNSPADVRPTIHAYRYTVVTASRIST